MLPVILFLVAGLTGCGGESESDMPVLSQEEATAEIEKLGGIVT